MTLTYVMQSWSRNSRYVLTASQDWNCIVWDLASDLEPLQRSRTIRFDVPVARATFHPRNRYVCACVRFGRVKDDTS
jgi:hypothetical protein